MNIQKTQSGEMNQNEEKMVIDNSVLAIIAIVAPVLFEQAINADFGAYTVLVSSILAGIAYYFKEKYNIDISQVPKK